MNTTTTALREHPTRTVHPVNVGRIPSTESIKRALYDDHPAVNGTGYLIMFDGKIAGWAAGLDHHAENFRLPWRPGAIALALNGSEEAFEADGGDAEVGAQKWTRITAWLAALTTEATA